MAVLWKMICPYSPTGRGVSLKTKMLGVRISLRTPNFMTVRDLYNEGYEYLTGTFFSLLRKGDLFTVNRTKKCEVKYVTEKNILIKCDNKNYSASLYKKDGKLIAFGGKGYNWHQLSVDIEGDILCDLLNEHNKFHDNSDSYKLLNDRFCNNIGV